MLCYSDLKQLYAATAKERDELKRENRDLKNIVWKQSRANRSMTDEELAKILLDGCRGSKCDDQPQNEWGSVNCFLCRMDWLKQPYKE